MINDIFVFYDNSLLYNPNSTFLLFFALFAFFVFLFFRCLWFLVRSLQLVITEVRQIHIILPHKKHPYKKRLHKKILLKKFILLMRQFLRVIDIIERKTLKRIHKILDAIAHEVLIPVIMVFMFLTPMVFAQTPSVMAYQFPWPGILPDHPLYKLKVLRNKIIAKIIYSPVKRVEFDLLMADKTLYASKLLLDKGQGDLAKETALKGENYFSILVTDYARAKGKNQVIPGQLRARIVRAYEAHQQLIDYLGQKAPEADKKTYRDIDFFSDENYRVLQNLQKPQP
ncbi:MAG: hypothetical protein AAB457_02125 [Patescibacteria group bacterium]